MNLVNYKPHQNIQLTMSMLYVKKPLIREVNLKFKTLILILLIPISFISADQMNGPEIKGIFSLSYKTDLFPEAMIPGDPLSNENGTPAQENSLRTIKKKNWEERSCIWDLSGLLTQ